MTLRSTSSNPYHFNFFWFKEFLDHRDPHLLGLPLASPPGSFPCFFVARVLYFGHGTPPHDQQQQHRTIDMPIALGYGKTVR